MSEHDKSPPQPGTELVIKGDPSGAAPVPQRVVREFRTVESVMGIMDTARFEHLGRVATVMARAGLMPMTLTHEGPETNRVALPFEVVQARAYLIANQADLWHADPNAVAQCTSLVYNRLMYEGKLVHGIISARLGVDLDYEFGRYDRTLRDIKGTRNAETGEWVGDMPGPDDQALGVRVVGTLPGEARARWIAGSVAMWHKGAKSPWNSPDAWTRQLRYMGAREWARAHKPSLLLGIITDDEVDEYEIARAVGAVAPAPPQLLHAGFEDRRPVEVENPPPRNAADAQASVAGKRKARAAAAPPKDVLEGDDVPKEGGQRPTGTAGAQAAGSEPATSETATHASGDGAAASSGQQGSEKPTGDGAGDELPPEPERETTEGEPAADEVYHLADSGWFWDPRRGDYARETYKNGEPFSTAAASKELAIYADHAQEAPAAGASDEAVAEGEDDGEEEVLPPEFATYADAIDAAKTFGEVKKAMSAFYNTDFFKALRPEQQNKVRADTWAGCVDNHITDLPDHAQDVSAFRLWIEFCDDAGAIMGTLAVLEKEPAFAQKDEGFKDAIRKATATRVAVLEG